MRKPLPAGIEAAGVGGVAGGARPPLDRHFRYLSPWLAVFVIAWIAGLLVLAPNASELVRDNWVFAPIGAAGAILGNISAVGGGIVFIPTMIFLFHFPPVAALKIALATQSWGMTSGAIGWIQKGVVPLRALRIALPGLLIGSAISSFVIHPNALLLKALFGPVSILLGCLTIVLTQRARPENMRNDIPEDARWPLLLTAIVGGAITGWIAIGEGELVAALLLLVYRVDPRISIGFGVVLLSINSIFLTTVHQLFLGGVPWNYAAFTGLGAVFGARLAPWISRRFNPRTLSTIFAAIAIGDGIVFIVQYALAR